jgi:hypothetical protein
MSGLKEGAAGAPEMDVNSRRIRRNELQYSVRPFGTNGLKEGAVWCVRRWQQLFTISNNCKLVHNRIRDTVAPFLVTVTTGLYGYEANNGMWGYVATGESAPEVSRNQLVSGSRRDQSSKRAFAERSQRLARVAVISRVRSFSVYFVVSCVSISW